MILVTGGTGFLGAYIIQNLIEQGQPVRAIRRSAGLPFFIPSAVLERVEWVDGDVLDVVSLQDAMQGVDGIIHAAAVVSFSGSDRRLMYQVNTEGTANVVNIALESGVKRLVHVSSIAALGRTGRSEMVTEKKKWEDSRSNTHYAISKHHAEMHVWRGFAEGLDGVIINPSTLLGYGDWHRSSAAIFKNAYREFSWYTRGVNGFVGVEDAAAAAVALLFSGINHKKFIVNADNWQFQHLFNTIADGFGKRRPSREAGKVLGGLAWRMEAVKAMITCRKPLLTRETAKVAQSRTTFDNSALLRALPDFSYTPLEQVIKTACEKYTKALQAGLLTL
ncbi:MAG TPA: NAD-dependent epimerase/dehydratase family protein [Flavisolibacter sp.]|nr:NAD-dependent epimerase/dehydratase family protein [Flavisolibacter sp.]